MADEEPGGGGDAPEALTHLDRRGGARMVDVSAKPATVRSAVATCRVVMAEATRALLLAGELPKGDALAVARIAGIMGAKRTPELLPLCHPLPLTGVEVVLEPADEGIDITASARTNAQTGVEMEALTAVAVAALALYDMVKSVERGVHIEGIRLLAKHGGRTGSWQAR